MKKAIPLLTAILAAATSHAAPPASAPQAISYQGVLLGVPGGGPEDGDRDMIFHFHDAAGGGEILRDLHTLADSRPVSVTNGMFDVEIGGGLMQDGDGVFLNDPYTSLSQMFRDFPEVLLEVEIRAGTAGGGGSFERLSPMTRVVSAAYALNADLIDGKEAAEFIDRSAAPQTKAGNLTVANLTATGSGIFFSAASASVSANSTSLFLSAGNNDTDDLFLVAGNSGDDGQIVLFGDGPIEFRAGTGEFSFVNGLTTLELARLDTLGDLRIEGSLIDLGDQITFGQPGARIQAFGTGLTVTAGDQDTDILLLGAGNSLDDGRLSLFGDGAIEIRSGNGEFSFVNGASAVEKAHLDAAGNLQVDGSITIITGHSIRESGFGAMVLDTAPGGSVAVLSDNVVTTIIDNDNNTSSATAHWCANGGCTGSSMLMEIQEDGDLRIGGSYFANQFDLAEGYLKGEPIEPGDLVRLDPRRAGAVLLSSGAADSTVLGVASERPGIILGAPPFDMAGLERRWGADIRDRLERERGTLVAEAAALDAPPSTLESLAIESFYERNVALVGLAGRVAVKVDTRFGDIAPGDPLSPSPIPGVAMKTDGRGVVVAIALEAFTGGRGKVEAFIARGQPGASAAMTERLRERAPDPETGFQSLPGHLQLVLDDDGDDDARLSVFRDGLRQDPGAEVFRVDEQGDVYARGAFRPNAMDVAELFPLGEPAGEGEVLAADPGRPGSFRPAREAADPTVIGVVSSRPGMLLGGGVDRILASDPALAAELEEARLANDRRSEARIWLRLESVFREAQAPVALAGTVRVKADASYGSIQAGDMLTSSPTPGHAMRAVSPVPPGTVIGKAIEPLASGQGLIRMLVMLR